MTALPEEAGVKPPYVADLEAAYSAPSQAGFGSAIFFTEIGPAVGLEQTALEVYQFFVGDLWQR